MRKSFGYGLALTALLLVGGGCAPATNKEAAETMPEAAAVKSTGGDSKMIDKADTSLIDATVDSIMIGSDAEKTMQAEAEKNADDVTTDSAELNSVMQGSYDLK